MPPVIYVPPKDSALRRYPLDIHAEFMAAAMENSNYIWVIVIQIHLDVIVSMRARDYSMRRGYRDLLSGRGTIKRAIRIEL